MIKAILFDFDGTLVDSESLHFAAWNNTLKKYDIKISEEDYLNNFAGIPTPQNASLLKTRYGIQKSTQELVNEKESQTALMGRNFDIPFMPFALELIEILKKTNLPMAIVTGSPRSEMEPTLKKAGIFEYFKYTITRDDVEKSKPDPEPYLKCVELMGFRKDEYLVFEDTWGGVKSAKAASLKCFGIQKSEDLLLKLKEAGADKTFKNLKTAYNYLIASGFFINNR